jgi:transposase-like protein
VECDEVYVVAGHKGHPEATIQQGRPGRRRRLKGAPGRGTLDKEKPPILGMIQRSGEVVIQMLANVQQQTIQPLIRQTIQPGTLIFTDEYAIYNQLEAWGYAHKTVNHAQAEYARDEDDDGFCEVHINTMEGFGRSCALGFALIAAFLKNNYRFTWLSLSLSIMFVGGARRCSLLCSLYS